MTLFVTRSFDAAVARRLEADGLPAPVARALAARGIARAEELDLRVRDLIAPPQLAHVDDAARLLADALAGGERLLIVADYDCDGATACAVGLRGLRALASAAGSRTSVDYLVPNRFEYGYGLTPPIVDLAAQRTPRPDWLITVDNGIASVEGVAARHRARPARVDHRSSPAGTTPAARRRASSIRTSRAAAFRARTWRASASCSMSSPRCARNCAGAA